MSFLTEATGYILSPLAHYSLQYLAEGMVKGVGTYRLRSVLDLIDDFRGSFLGLVAHGFRHVPRLPKTKPLGDRFWSKVVRSSLCLPCPWSVGVCYSSTLKVDGEGGFWITGRKVFYSGS